MQKPPMVHAAGTQSAAALQQQQQITQQPAASGEAYLMKTNLRSADGKHSIWCFYFYLIGTSQQTLTPAQAAQQQLRLQRLQQEQDRLRQRQQEIIAMVF